MQSVKLPRLNGVGIGPGTETYVIWGGPIAMALCLHQGNVYIKRKLRVWRAQKCIPLVVAKSPLTSTGRQTTPTQKSRYKTCNRNLLKFGWTDCHGTLLHQGNIHIKRKLRIWKSQKCSPSQCEKPSYLCGPSNYLVSRELVQG